MRKTGLTSGPVVTLISIVFFLSVTLLADNTRAEQVLDVDKNGETAPLTDGLLIIRHLFGFTGESLTQGAVANDAARKNHEEIEAYLLQIHSVLDVDGDLKTLPLTDGILILRALFGLTGDSLISSALAEGASRRSPSEVASYLASIGADSLPAVPSESDEAVGSPNNDEELLVFGNGKVDSTWDRGINAFDQALGWGNDCTQVGNSKCPSISWQLVAEPGRNDVLEITHEESNNLAGVFIASSQAVDLTAYARGHLEFDIKVISGDANITMKLDCFYPCTSGDQRLGEKGLSGWETVRVPISKLNDAGLKLGDVNTGIVIWATKSFGTVFRIDNVRFTGYDPNAGTEVPAVTVPFSLTRLGKGSYSDTINPASYRCVFDYGNWIYNAGVVEPSIPFCDTASGTPQGNPVPKKPQLAGSAASQHTMTHRWWGSIPFLGEMRVGDTNGAGYITPDPIMARLSERGVRVMGIPPGLRANSGGFGYAVPDPFAEVFDGAAIANDTHANMDVKLLRHSEGSTTAGWFEGSTLVMEATFVSGSPYVFFDVHSGSPVFKTLRASGPERGIWHQSANTLGIWSNVAGQLNHFLLVGDSGSSFSDIETNSVKISTPNNSFTLIWAPETRETIRKKLEKYARNIVGTVRIDYSVDPLTNSVTIDHNYLDETGNPVETLVGLMPLHWKRAAGLTYLSSVRSARGTLKFAPTSGFEYDLPSVGVLPSLPLIPGSLDETKLMSLVRSFMAEGSDSWNSANDTYWSGKAIARAAEVLALADQLQMKQEAETLRDWLKEELADWMSAERAGTLDSGKYFVYDDQWNTLLGLEESFASHQQLNDHHFHYGYFIRAAAEVCRVDENFCKPDQYGGMFELLIRDYAGGKGDPMFPYLRNFDPAYGFSWASGHANFVRGNNNESTSEAANAYGAMVLYGLATGNSEIMQRGLYLHASTSASFWEYWNDIDGFRGDDPVARNFPPGYPRLTTSIIWGDGSAFSTWFSPAFAHILGIQGLPSNPLTMHVGLFPDYLEHYVALGLSESSNRKPSGLPKDHWTDLWWNLWSMTDPEAAIADYESTQSYYPEAGEAPAHTFHWLYTMRSLGTLQTGTGALTADYPAAMAFKTASGLVNYVVYNYSDNEIKVAFSDGNVVTAQPNSFSVISQ